MLDFQVSCFLSVDLFTASDEGKSPGLSGDEHDLTRSQESGELLLGVSERMRQPDWIGEGIAGERKGVSFRRMVPKPARVA